MLPTRTPLTATKSAVTRGAGRWGWGRAVLGSASAGAANRALSRPQRGGAQRSRLAPTTVSTTVGMRNDLALEGACHSCSTQRQRSHAAAPNNTCAAAVAAGPEGMAQLLPREHWGRLPRSSGVGGGMARTMAEAMRIPSATGSEMPRKEVPRDSLSVWLLFVS